MKCSHSLQMNGICSYCLRRVEPVPGTVEPIEPERASDDDPGPAALRAARAEEQLSLLWGEA